MKWAGQSGEEVLDKPLKVESMTPLWIRLRGTATDDVRTDCGALSEAVVFLNRFKDMPDPRQRGKVMYPLEEVLLLALLAVLAGAESFVDIPLFRSHKPRAPPAFPPIPRRYPAPR